MFTKIFKKALNFFLISFLKKIYKKKISKSHLRWIDFQTKILLEMSKISFDEFLTADTIKSTMFKDYDQYSDKQLEFLNKNFFKSFKKDLFIEKFFTSKLDKKYLLSIDPNTIHHCYHLAKYESLTGKKISEFDNIYEFGGGYGNMIRIIKKINKKTNYICYDLKILSDLQKRFLITHGFYISENFNENYSDQIILTNYFKKYYFKGKSLFISTWGLSETTIAERIQFESFINAFDSVLIASQDFFEGIDNHSYFKKFDINFEKYHLNNSKNFYGFK